MAIESPARVTRNNAHLFVEDRAAFDGSNLYGRAFGDSYVVFSYGEHWPLYIYHEGKWYENCDSASRTTSRHRTVARPRFVTTEEKSVDDMRRLFGAIMQKR